MSDKLEKLLKLQEKLKVQIQKEEAKAKVQDRKYDKRRKAVIGMVVMESMKKDRELSEQIKNLLTKMLKKDTDRKLFELPLLNKKTK